MNISASPSDIAAREIASTRVFDAPRSLVWRAWSSPEAIGEWWGPNGFTTTTDKFEFRPGGEWIFTMHGPDGTDYPNEVTFAEIVEFERIAYDHGPSPKFQVTVLFDEEDGKTKLSMRMVFGTMADRELADKFGAVEGLHQTLGRLEEYLRTF